MTEKKHHEQILDIILDKNKITWQTIIYDLVNSEQMDPWNVDVSLLTKKYIEMIKSLKEHDFRVSGKVLLAAALLLKIKSTKWIKEDIANLDALFSSAEDDMDDLLDGLEDDHPEREQVDATLIPRTPQPRKRKVSVYDLVNALEKALEVKHRRVLRDIPIMDIKRPVKKKDISEVIKDIYKKIMHFFQKSERLTFTKLLPSTSKEDRIYTFIPLLHLTNQGKIDINQYQHFGEIEIILKKDLDKELKSEKSI
ncbi:segregation/condensation protein A [Candidatus Woesearchaeota archaeon]|nr:segregation/condensation protein A [Candidatus Woesearchaeota archaeon]